MWRKLISPGTAHERLVHSRVVIFHIAVESTINVILDCRLLIPRSAKVIAKPTRALKIRILIYKPSSAPNRGHIWASSRKDGIESRLVIQIAPACIPGSGVSAREDNRTSAESKQTDHSTNTPGISLRDGVFVVAIGMRDHIWKIGVVLSDKPPKVCKVRLVEV